MGRSKAALEWHGTTLLRRTVDVLRRALDGQVVVVRAPGQPLPPLPGDVDVRDDPREGQGPLQGMAVGLAAAGESSEVAFVCSTDLPFLHPVYVERVVGALAAAPDVDLVLPHARGHRQPLAAAYRTLLAPLVAALLDEGLRKPAMLLGLATSIQTVEGKHFLQEDVPEEIAERVALLIEGGTDR